LGGRPAAGAPLVPPPRAWPPEIPQRPQPQPAPERGHRSREGVFPAQSRKAGEVAVVTHRRQMRVVLLLTLLERQAEIQPLTLAIFLRAKVRAST
jgi:hypothetical protein